MGFVRAVGSVKYRDYVGRVGSVGVLGSLGSVCTMGLWWLLLLCRFCNIYWLYEILFFYDCCVVCLSFQYVFFCMMFCWFILYLLSFMKVSTSSQ